MPGTTMGNKATYKNPESVKKNLLVPIVEKLKSRLNRQDIQLVIEKEKLQSGAIHKSMFSEAETSDVYIADLTGSNPNVYLELGVRWAVRDNVTIMIAQSVDDLKFNVGANRAFIYSPENIIQAIDDIATAVETGLKTQTCDSIVRVNSDLVTISKSEIENLENEIDRLKKARGEDLINAAKATDVLSEKLLKLQQAADANPASAEAFLELGKAYRDASKYDKAVESLISAHRLKPVDAIINRELGVTYSKQNKLELAINFLREAVRLNPGDKEAWSNLGGALRRWGMIDAPASFHQKYLEEARDSYSQALKIDKFDLYAGLNIARLNLLLSKWDRQLFQLAQEQFRKQIHLCRYEVDQSPHDYWRLFDLADALLFSGEPEQESSLLYDKAVELIPSEERKDKLNSVVGPFENYLAANVLDDPLKTNIERVIASLRLKMK